MIGRTYLERGQPVVVVVRWQHTPPSDPPAWLTWRARPRRAPRNVLIRRADGSRTVRPFRGLRRIP